MNRVRGGAVNCCARMERIILVRGGEEDVVLVDSCNRYMKGWGIHRQSRTLVHHIVVFIPAQAAMTDFVVCCMPSLHRGQERTSTKGLRAVLIAVGARSGLASQANGATARLQAFISVSCSGVPQVSSRG